MSDQPYKALVPEEEFGKALQAAMDAQSRERERLAGQALDSELLDAALRAAAPFLTAPLVAELEEAERRSDEASDLLEAERREPGSVAREEFAAGMAKGRKELEEARGALASDAAAAFLIDHLPIEQITFVQPGEIDNEELRRLVESDRAESVGRAKAFLVEFSVFFATLYSSDTCEGERCPISTVPIPLVDLDRASEYARERGWFPEPTDKEGGDDA